MNYELWTIPPCNPVLSVSTHFTFRLPFSLFVVIRFHPCFSSVPSSPVGWYPAFLLSYCALLPLGFHILQSSIQTQEFDLNSYCPLHDQLHHELTLEELGKPHNSVGQVPQAHCQPIQNSLFPLPPSPAAALMVSNLPDTFRSKVGPVFFQGDSSLKPAKLIYHHLPWDLFLT